MPAPDEIKILVEKFSKDYAFYTAPTYNETEVRIQFVNPFFRALGWDVDNTEGRYEVIHEDRVIIDEGGSKNLKHPDYGFRTGSDTRFFVETKKPSVNIELSRDAAFQVRRYGWSAKHPASVLTDFEEFTIYDCRIKPAHSDSPTKGRLYYYTYKDYIEKWDEIADLLSRDAVHAGKLEELVGKKKVKGSQTVDDAFLAEMEEWRVTLAKEIANRNHDMHLKPRDLNNAVQRIIDRIVFLRIAEDRGIELYGRLRDFTAGSSVYENLKQLFRQADQRYNSGLFYLRDDRTGGDELTMRLQIKDEPLKKIIRNLYYPHSPYEFSVLPADILGQVYERFLGKVIRLTDGGRAKVEEKPEVRKAGGVYYTPTYIVDYIVENTVGKLLDEAKTPDEASTLRILDPACGSGSFLIGAYQYLLDWHLDWYINDNPKKHIRATRIQPVDGSDRYTLTTDEKKRILVNNIYGVDLDQQAVEVTKLSLLLKVMEGDVSAGQGQLLSERILPDLGDNIKWGNSLIGPDYYDGVQMNMFPDEEELNRIKVFDWHSEKDGFGKIMKAGGFDAVIGNPPWVFTKYVQWAQDTKDYIQLHYLSDRESSGQSKARQAGKINLFAIFVLKGIELLKQAGNFGFIIPNNILRTTVYDIVRKQVLEKYRILRIVDLKSGVFENVTASTICLLIQSKKPDAEHKICVTIPNLVPIRIRVVCLSHMPWV